VTAILEYIEYNVVTPSCKVAMRNLKTYQKEDTTDCEPSTLELSVSTCKQMDAAPQDLKNAGLESKSTQVKYCTSTSTSTPAETKRILK